MNIAQINIFYQAIQSGQFSGLVPTVIYHSINFCNVTSYWFGGF